MATKAKTKQRAALVPRSEVSKPAKAKRQQFQKGQSGNPAGRKPLTLAQREYADLLKTHTKEALLKVLQLMRQKHTPRLALDASIFLIEQAYGKSKQRIDATVRRGLAELTHDDLVRIAGGGRTFEADGSEGESSPVH